MVREGEYVSVGEAAKLLGISRQRVHQLIRKGRIRAIRVGNQYIIPVRDVERRKKVMSSGRFSRKSFRGGGEGYGRTFATGSDVGGHPGRGS